MGMLKRRKKGPRQLKGKTCIFSMTQENCCENGTRIEKFHSFMFGITPHKIWYPLLFCSNCQYLCHVVKVFHRAFFDILTGRALAPVFPAASAVGSTAPPPSGWTGIVFADLKKGV